mmetsp:Transcript_23035/g.32449  ORF Transcript_23035/g.32449 Transcript_23035/m.32449 type:complete len:638 (-) Transcript_23035:38-1951(-)
MNFASSSKLNLDYSKNSSRNETDADNEVLVDAAITYYSSPLFSFDSTDFKQNTNVTNENFEEKDKSTHPQNHVKRGLRLLPLTALVFYSVSGGPFGIEPAVRSGGNLPAILGFTFLPLVWSVPEALMTAELGSMLPGKGGAGVDWATEAFGDTMGCVVGYWGWISGVTDNAIYPSLFLDYLMNLFQEDYVPNDDDGNGGQSRESLRAVEDEKNGTSSGHSLKKQKGKSRWERFFLSAIIGLSISCLNHLGLEVSGSAGLILCVISMSPFVILCILGLPQVHPYRWLKLLPSPSHDSLYNKNTPQKSFWSNGPLFKFEFGNIDLKTFLHNLFWNLNSFDAAASWACEIHPKAELGTTYPRGIFLALVMIILCYLLPLLVATGATDNPPSEWTDGYLSIVASQIAANYNFGWNGEGKSNGKWLEIWTIFAAGISNLGLFLAEMEADSYNLAGMANQGFVPKILAKRTARFHAPSNAIMVGTFVVICMGVADFEALVEMLNFNYAMSLLVEYAAFVTLRYRHSNQNNRSGEFEKIPYSVPLPNLGIILIVTPACFMIIFLLLLSSGSTYVYILLVQAVGAFIYYLRNVAIQRGWCEFEKDMTRSDGDNCFKDNVDEKNFLRESYTQHTHTSLTDDNSNEN